MIGIRHRAARHGAAGQGSPRLQRLLLQIEFGVLLDRELIDQGLGFLEGSCPQAELDFSLRGVEMLDV